MQNFVIEFVVAILVLAVYLIFPRGILGRLFQYYRLKRRMRASYSIREVYDTPYCRGRRKKRYVQKRSRVASRTQWEKYRAARAMQLRKQRAQRYAVHKRRVYSL